MTRRWTGVPTGDDIAITPPAGCCFDADTVQDGFEQLLHMGSLVAVKVDGGAVIGYCDLVKFNAAEVSLGYLYKATV